MAAPIAVQLYSLREALAQDFEGVLRRVADMGYVGVETAKMYGKGPSEAARLIRELGMQICSAHMPAPVGDQKNEVLDTLAALGCKYTIVPWIAPEEFSTRDRIMAVCDGLNEANANARANGITLAYHNHWAEFETPAELGGKTPFQLMIDQLDKSIHFEIDTYWAKTAGNDPVEAVKLAGKRAPYLHIKDGPAVKDEPMTAVGDGVIDVRAIVAASQPYAEWLIVELDRSATDMEECVRKSYAYMTHEGLARGTKN